jgi:hypothetical protein
MVKRIIKLKKRPRGKPLDPISKIAGTADRKAIRVIKKKQEKTIKTNLELNDSMIGLKNPQEYLEFVYWLATPIDLREIKTQEDFAAKIGVTKDTLTNWKKREGFQDLLMDTIKSNFRERSASVLRAVERRAHASGGNQDAALFFKVTGMIKDGSELKLGIDDELKNALDKVAKALPD